MSDDFTTPLPTNIELGVLSAMAAGHVEPSLVSGKDLSGAGLAVYQAIKFMRTERGHAGEIDLPTLSLMAQELTPKESPSVIESCIRDMTKYPCGATVAELVDLVRTKQQLQALCEEASDQMATSQFDRAKLMELLEGVSGSTKKLVQVSDKIGETLPPIPTGNPIDGMPKLTKQTGGIVGLWAIGGEAGTGKTSLGIQIAISEKKYRPVLYYDMENGEENLIHRVGAAYGNDVEQTREALRNIYFRHDIKTLYDDLAAVGVPCLVVLDSFQKLPTQEKYKTSGLESWLRKFEVLKEAGHAVILLSEKNRESYGRADQGGFKGTGEIEYSADVGVQLIKYIDPDKDETAEDTENASIMLHIVKNRPRDYHGFRFDLVRVNAWALKERYVSREEHRERMEAIRAGRSQPYQRQALPSQHGRSTRYSRPLDGGSVQAR